MKLLQADESPDLSQRKECALERLARIKTRNLLCCQSSRASLRVCLMLQRTARIQARKGGQNWSDHRKRVA